MSMADEDDQAPVEESAESQGDAPVEAAPTEEKEAIPAAQPAPKPAARGSEKPGAVYDIPVEITAVLGTATLQVSQLLKLGRGAVVELDRKVDEEIEIHANNRLVARGEVMVINDRLAVTMTDIVKGHSGR